MDHMYTSNLDELSMEGKESKRRSIRSKRKCDNNNNNNDDDDSKYKSKNLKAERKRRAKLNERLLHLRTLVPIITNMTKSYIIEDAITFIEKLESQIKELNEELQELEETCHEKGVKPTQHGLNNNGGEEMKTCGIETELDVIPIDDNKFWIKVVWQNEIGGLTKLVETITGLGYEFNDTNYTTVKGVAMVTSCLERICDGRLDDKEAKETLLCVLSNIM